MIVVNPSRDPTWTGTRPPAAARDFHRSIPGYAPTRLAVLPDLARKLGVARLLAKDESNRLGLPAFKALGASWAIHRALRERPPTGPVTIVTATDGNHGRAVARFARQFGHRAAIFVPDGIHPAAVQAIRDEGASVTHVRGDYDAAVQVAASKADAETLLVQDMAWDGYEDIPSWIVEGYTTLFAELDEQLDDGPDLLIVPAGVGSLLQAALSHYRSGDGQPTIVSVEPQSAACVLASVAAGHPVTIATESTSMAGLNCGTVSSLAWPSISRGLDAAIAVSDAEAAVAARELSEHGVDAGPCGAAPLAAMNAIRADMNGTASVLLLVTEGSAANPA